MISKTRDFIVPPLCMLCDALLDEPGGCCPRCWSKIRFIAPPFCPVMGTPFGYDIASRGLEDTALSAEAIADPPPFSRLRSVVLYDEKIRKLITGLKYSDRLDLAPWMANWMVRAGAELIESRPIVVPIPLHPLRLLQRRYNQSGELARHICEKTGLQFSPGILVRFKKTRQQVGLSERERARNVQGAFKVKPDQVINISGRHVLLVDDVYTSGATVKSATRALKRAGASQIDVLTFSRVEVFQNEIDVL